MTEKQDGNGNTALAAMPDVSLEEWGTREDIAALSRRIQSMLPGGDRMKAAQAMALAQYAIALDANPFRGEIYGFVSRGQFVLVDGYKVLVRWAKRQCPYSERYEPLDEDELPKDAIGFRCWILRDDARATLRDLVQAGADFGEAYEITATSAVGIVTKADRTDRSGKPIDPPKGWTWQQVARKRALKNALNLSHGAPSPKEIARESWRVGETETIPEDWTDCAPGMLPIERERLAKLNAQYREMQEERENDDRTPEEILAEGRALLRGDDQQEVLI